MVRPLAEDTEGERLAVAFGRLCRRLGLQVPASATVNFAQALGVVGLDNRSDVYWAGRATMVHDLEDVPAFDQAFRVFWEQQAVQLAPNDVEAEPIPVVLDTDEADSLEGDEPGSDEIEAVRFSRVEILTEKDFSQCSDDEIDELGRLMAAFRFTSFRRRSRRQAPSRRSGDRLDFGRTVRRALRHQGEAIRWERTRSATRPRRLVFLLDVSGSMESYARALIRFAHAAVVARGRVEVFTIGTRLTRLTRQLNHRDPDAALRAASPELADWAGGTRLGEALQQFNDEWGVRGLARGGVVVILSDGWDRGDPAQLGEQMERLHRVTHRLIWVNPLKASPGYAPLAAGMAAAIPHVDEFVPGHNYRSLEGLAAILSRDASGR